MRPKTLLLLFLVVVGLGAFIWFFERDLPGTDERARLEKRVLAVEPEEITELIIERAGARVHLARPAADDETAPTDDSAQAKREWRLLEPHDARADTAAADRLANSLANLEKERTLDQVDSEAVGLDPPRATVTVRTADSETTLRVGAEIPASSNMVVAAGAGTYVVPDAVWSSLETEPGEWRGRDLFPLHRGAVERIELSSGNQAVTLARRGESFWMEAPIEDLAESERVDGLLDAMFRVQVQEFLDQPELAVEAMGLEPAADRLAATFTGRERPVVLELGDALAAEPEQRYARIEGQLVTIGDDLDAPLAGVATDWQATGWTALEVYEIDSLRIVDQGGEMLLERSGADWKRDGVEISYSPVSDFLYALTGAAGERVLARDQARALGADLDQAELQLALKGSEVEETLSLHPAGAAAVAARDGRAYVLELSTGTVEDLRVKLQAIREQEPLTADDEDEEG